MSASGRQDGDLFEVTVGDIYTRSSGSTDPTQPLFRETQGFKQWIFMVPIIVVAAIVWWQFVQQVILSKPQGEEPIPDWLAWVLTILFGIGLPILASRMRLVTEVRPGRVTLRLAPFQSRTIVAEEVLKAVVRQYSALKEYGGWGVKTNRWNGRAYVAHGDKGVQLVLATKELVLIGSQRPEELLSALQLAGADLGRYDELLAEAAAAVEDHEAEEAEEDEAEDDEEAWP
ncbi:MAG: hypothetical protein JW990_17310 [Thermoleophilia bacterium]|nr:hypothetical protein [Thermoleophilia bacterium]